MKELLKKKFSASDKKKGFSLIELSIVVTIVAVLITGALAVSVTKIKGMKTDDTKERMEKIYAALKTYVKAEGVLPCPASMTEIKSTSDNYGVVDSTQGTCTDGATGGVYSAPTTDLVYGLVPVQELGISEELAEDAFGTKFAYIVDTKLTNTMNYNGAAIITIVDSYYDSATSAVSTREIAQEAAFALVSYGPNKSGGYNANSSVQITRSSNSNEMENDLDGSLEFDDILVASAAWDDTFDDMIFFVDIRNLLVDAEALSNISCPAGTDNNDVVYGTTVMQWPTATYGQVVAADGPGTSPDNGKCPTDYTAGPVKPTKRCGAFGQWEEGAVSPCLENGNGAYGGDPVSGNLECTGGTIDTSSVPGYTVHIFNFSSSLVCTGDGELEYLIVGGGGGGGGLIANEGGGGGGGGGGVTTGKYTVSDGQTITITVGNGGNGGSGGDGSNGIASFLGAIVSSSGGAGGLQGGDRNGNGGASGNGQQGGEPNSHDNDHVAGGGGGGSGINENSGVGGESSNHDGGAGGNGTPNNITGTSITYGSGGGGGAGGGKSIGNVGAGGQGSGGNGANDNSAAVAGTTNRGGGGGGGAHDNTSGAAGGSGVVIVRYLTSGGGSDPCTGGSLTYAGGKTIHTFRSDGSFTCSTAVSNVSYLVVGAGGGGGGIASGFDEGGGGGGGGGGVSSGTYNVGVETLTVTVGNGGPGGSAANGSSGTSSSISGSLSVTSTGGGGGTIGPDQIGDKDNNTVNDPPNGGASGSGDTSARAGGLGWDRGHQHGSGGGGSSMASAGGDVEPTGNDHQGGAGGNGTPSDISGVTVTYGSGGGGGAGGGKNEGPAGAGGTSSGGYGATEVSAPGSGTNGGGGGGGSTNSQSTGGNGGDGVVIFSYTTP